MSLGLLGSHVHVRWPVDAPRSEAAPIDAGGRPRAAKRGVGEERPPLPHPKDDDLAGSRPVKFACLFAVGAILVHPARGEDQVPVAVSRVARCLVDGPLDGHAEDLPQPAGVHRHQVDLLAQGQFVRQRQDQRAGDLGVPAFLRPFGDLPVHGANAAGGENLPSLAGVVVDAAGALVHLAGAGGVGPLVHGRVALPARDSRKIEMKDCHARLRAAGVPHSRGSRCKDFTLARARIDPRGQC